MLRATRFQFFDDTGPLSLPDYGDDLFHDFWVKRITDIGVPLEYLNPKTTKYLANVLSRPPVEVVLEVRDCDANNPLPVVSECHDL